MDVLIVPIFTIIKIGLSMLYWCTCAHVLLSLLFAFDIVNTSSRLVNIASFWIHRILDPILMPIRRITPMASVFDMSPIVLVIIIIFLDAFVSRTLMKFM